ncbi:MAG: T9SS type A sorting domain-containing protein [Saprospiraceae bacterium]|nr:T9SS type A sorting domain-containing protein [Saprospiraceae bacterium]
MTKTFYPWVMGLCLLLTPLFLKAQCDVVQSNVTTDTGLGYLELNDPNAVQTINVVTNSTAAAAYVYMLTNSSFNIVEFMDGPTATIDLCPYNAGKYFIWGMSYSGSINLNVGDLVFTGPFSSGCFLISLTAVVVQKNFDGGNCSGDPCAGVDGGMVMLQNGGTDTTIVIDANPDPVSFTSNITPTNFAFTYIVTDANDNILAVPAGNMVDFNGAGVGVCHVYGLAYTGNLNAMMGDPILTTDLSDDCFDLSNNFLTVNRISDTTTANRVAQFFVSSNTQPLVGVYHILSNGSIDAESFPSVAGDADGIYYSMSGDVLYQLNRTDNVINAYGDVNASLDMGNDPVVTATSMSDFTNGREIAVSGDKLIVVQDAAASNGNTDLLLVYQITQTGFDLLKTFEPGFALWGIALNGSTLYAVEDLTNNVYIFKNIFNQPSGFIDPTNVVTVEGIVRTHGITYEASGDRLILTDIGDAANPNDGAFTIISNFDSIMANGFIQLGDQVRVEGPNSMLGNPVDIAIDNDRNMIYVAERANGGGRVLCFNVPTTSGDATPTYNDLFAGVSAIHFPSPDQDSLTTVSQLFVSSNTQGNVGVFDIKNNAQLVASTFPSEATDADGIYFDKDADVLYQLNRTDNVINAYSSVNANLMAGMDPILSGTSTSDFANGREIAVNDSFIVVVQDADPSNTNTNAFYIYEKSPTALNLVKSYTTSFNLWGIHLDTTTLYAVEDNSNMVAIFNDFFNQPAGPITPSQEVEIEGITRTHGLTYYAADDVLFLTDIGDAANPNDGAFVIIWNFGAVSGDGVVDLGEQVRIEGPSTMLGNPVDIALDRDAMIVYLAERANGGGKVLAFGMPVNSGDYSPMYSAAFDGASAVYLSGGEDMMFTGNQMNSWYRGRPVVSAFKAQTKTPGLKVYPNPVSSNINLAWEQPDATLDSEVIIRIIDNQGREIRSQKAASVEGLNNLQLYIENLRPGMYHVFVTGDGMVRHQRFVKE